MIFSLFIMSKNSFYMSVFYDDPETMRNCSRLSYAIQSNDLEFVRRLLSKTPEMVHMVYGADKLLPLERAICLDVENMRMIEAIVEFGADVKYINEQTGNSLMHIAARQNKPRIVEWLISLGAPLNEINSDGYTPLMEAVCNVYTSLFLLLHSITYNFPC